MKPEDKLQKKLKDVEKRLSAFSSLAIAFSGGVDSTFLLAVAKRTHPENVLAITVSSAFVPEKETEAAKEIATSFGVEHICINVDIFKNSDVVSNPADRCYHCKYQIFSQIRQAAESLGFNTLLHGVNLDDLNDYRPGLKAAEELGFLSPLADAKLTKTEIRRLSRQLKLSTWNKPSQSCLATRIPYNEKITDQALTRIEKAETFLKTLGFEQVRVRCHGRLARIEMEPALMDMMLKKEMRKKISAAFSDIGFAHTSIDIDGYQTGKMNYEILSG